jgi:endonuclease G
MRASGLRYRGSVMGGAAGALEGAKELAGPPAGVTESGRRRMRLASVATVAKASSLVLAAEATGARRIPPASIVEIAQERIIGGNDLQDVNYLEVALAVARGVARIKLPNGAATGFLVGPGVLLTNNHVFPTPESARRSIAQFDFLEPIGGRDERVHSFGLEPERFFLTDPALDFSFVAVGARADTGRPIEAYPWSKLIEALGKAETGDPINIIQHPLGGWKQIALRNNRVIDIPSDRKDFLYYETDTERGSSGSPCFNDQWEVIALHHQGVPKMRGQTILRKDGKPWADTDDPRQIDWIANEGARVSAIVAAVKAAGVPSSFAATRRAILENEAPNPVELSRNSESFVQAAGYAGNQGPGSGQGFSFTVPLTVSITIGSPGPAGEIRFQQAAVQGAPVPLSGAIADASAAVSEEVVIDPDWSTRKGYDTRFLGRTIPLPRLSTKLRKLTAKVPEKYRRKGDPYALDYHHYSLAMRSDRRFAWYSAANIDGAKKQVIPPRKNDKWFIDPRIDPPGAPAVQCGEELYAAKLTDRGHLTRYLDLAWGDTPAEAIDASNDSFHFTNCCLQLKGFNELSDRWQGLEKFLLEKKAVAEKRQLVVFTGPVFDLGDPRYSIPKMGYAVQIPLRFWKVCVLERADGTFAATAFVLGQPDVTSLPGFEAAFDVVAAQTTVKFIESLTGLDFGDLRTIDHLTKGGAPGTLESLELFGGPVRPLQVFEDIDF